MNIMSVKSIAKHQYKDKRQSVPPLQFCSIAFFLDRNQDERKKDKDISLIFVLSGALCFICGPQDILLGQENRFPQNSLKTHILSCRHLHINKEAEITKGTAVHFQYFHSSDHNGTSKVANYQLRTTKQHFIWSFVKQAIWNWKRCEKK